MVDQVSQSSTSDEERFDESGLPQQALWRDHAADVIESDDAATQEGDGSPQDEMFESDNDQPWEKRQRSPTKPHGRPWLQPDSPFAIILGRRIKSSQSLDELPQSPTTGHDDRQKNSSPRPSVNKRSALLASKDEMSRTNQRSKSADRLPRRDASPDQKGRSTGRRPPRSPSSKDRSGKAKRRG